MSTGSRSKASMVSAGRVSNVGDPGARQSYKLSKRAHDLAYWSRLCATHDGVISAMAAEAGVERAGVRHHLRRLGLYNDQRPMPTSSAEVLAAVASGIRTVAGVVNNTGLSRGTVRRHVRHLRRCGRLLGVRGSGPGRPLVLELMSTGAVPAGRKSRPIAGSPQIPAGENR